MSNEKRIKLNNAGFTLVEMIIVLVIMVIMLSLSVVGVMAWQDWSKMKQLNANAEAIFVAAQNQLSEYSASGSLETEVQALIDKDSSGSVLKITEDGGDNSIAIGSITDPDGNVYVWNKLWNTGGDESIQGTIVSVSSEPGDYERFLNRDLENQPGKELLFKLVTSYIYDKSILNDSAIMIEFSPDAAQVLAVCYSTGAKRLSYSDNDADAVCVSSRSETVRNDLALGYYGVKSLSMYIKGKTDNTLDMEADSFELRNEEILSAIYVPKAAEADELFGNGKNHSFIFYVYDAEKDDSDPQKRLMTFEFSISSNKPLPSGMKQAQGKNATDIFVRYCDAAGEPSGDTYIYRMPVWMELTERGDRAIRLALDAADIQAQSIVYASAMSISGETEDETEGETEGSAWNPADAEKAFSETYSFYRFGLDVDKIYLGLKIRDNNTDTGASTSENKTERKGEYVTFASVSRDAGKQTAEYKISNGRHLYNMRYVEDYADRIDKSAEHSAGDLNNNRDWYGDYCRTFLVTNDIDWHLFTAYNYRASSAGENFLFNSYTVGDTIPSGIGIAGIETETAEFPSIRQINAGDSFIATKENGGNYSISNLTITTEANERYGVYGFDTQHMIIEYLKSPDKVQLFDILELERAKGEHPTGLFVYNFGTVKDVTLYKHKVFGAYKVGGFVGENMGLLSGLYLKNDNLTDHEPDKTENYMIKKIVGIKQIVPYFYGSNKDGGIDYYKINYQDAYDNSRVEQYITEQLYGRNSSFVAGIHDVGGICGYQKYVLYGEGLQPSASYNMLKNEAQVAGQAYLGGIIGRSIVNYSDNGETDRYTVTVPPSDALIMDDNGSAQSRSLTRVILQKVEFVDNENYGRVQALSVYDIDGEGDSDELGDITNRSLSDSHGPNARNAYFIGGICGMACDNTVTQDNSLTFPFGEPLISFRNCRSYWLYSNEEINELINGEKNGFVSFRPELRGSYIGGITGFARRVLFDNCTTALNDERTNDGKPFIFGMYYVGGIAGAMQVCGVKNETGSLTTNEINVIGRRLVGGIAGFIGTPKYNNKNTVTADGLYEFQYNSHGIDFYQNPSEGNKNIAGEINGVLNTAASFAIGGKGNDVKRAGWVGGICGFNSEKLNNCDSIMSIDSKLIMLRLIDMTGDDDYYCDYSGGLVGRDAFTINTGSGYSSKINTIVYGDDYVGGAVGGVFLDNVSEREETILNCYLVDAEDGGINIEGKENFAGSYIFGRNNCVGGTCGIIGILKDKGKGSAAVFNESATTGDFIVHGKNYVGGFVGYARGCEGQTSCQYSAELLAKDGGIQSVKADGFYAGGFAGAISQQVNKTSNPDARRKCVAGVTDVSASYFAGGFAGVGITPKSDVWKPEWLSHNSNYTVGNRSIEMKNMEISARAVAGGYYGFYAVTAGINDLNGPENLLAMLESYNEDEIITVLDSLDYKTVFNMEETPYTDTGKNSNKGQYVNNLVIEFDEDSISVNSVTAKYCAGGVFGYVPERQSIYISCKTNTTVTTYASNEELLEGGYSYAGGITGKVGSRMVLSGCESRGVTDSASIYFGPLTELNKGIITDCTVGYAHFSMGANGKLHEYVGGLCGRNEGIIGYTVDGRGSKFGSARVRGDYEEYDVTGMQYVGGLCGINAGGYDVDGKPAGIYIDQDYGYIVSVDSEEYAGGLCGVNDVNGKIIVSSETGAGSDKSDKAVVAGKYAGLIAGLNYGTIEGITINDDIQTGIEKHGDGSFVAVFTGENTGTIKNCVNKKSISISGCVTAGFAGVAKDGARFEDIKNTGDIAAGDVAAGIAAVGEGSVTFEDCRNYGKITSDSDKAYGITGIENARINKCIQAGAGVTEKNRVYPENCSGDHNILISGRIDVPMSAEEFNWNGSGLMEFRSAEQEDGYELYAIKKGIPYKSGFGRFTYDPQNFDNKTDRVEEIEQKLR